MGDAAGPLAAAIATWPVPNVAAASVHYDGAVETAGDIDRPFRLASVTKLLSVWAALVAVEEGSLALDAPIGQPGCTLRHLLSHAGGYPFSGSEPISAVERRRVYSNSGIELAADAVAAATGLPFATYLDEAVFQPLGMRSSELITSAAYGVTSTVADMIAFLGEIIEPRLLAPATVAEAMTVQYPTLSGRVPGVGVFNPCAWGLGFEIHGAKHPHWMGSTNSPATVGHFGSAGTMLWVDPVHRTSLVALTDRRFEEWPDDALRLWPELSDQLVGSAAAAMSFQGGRQE